VCQRKLDETPRELVASRPGRAGQQLDELPPDLLGVTVVVTDAEPVADLRTPLHTPTPPNQNLLESHSDRLASPRGFETLLTGLETEISTAFALVAQAIQKHSDVLRRPRAMMTLQDVVGRRSTRCVRPGLACASARQARAATGVAHFPPRLGRPSRTH
jgi:hypothetical protein